MHGLVVCLDESSMSKLLDWELRNLMSCSPGELLEALITFFGSDRPEEKGGSAGVVRSQLDCFLVEGSHPLSQ